LITEFEGKAIPDSQKLALLLSFIAAFTITAVSNDIGFKTETARVQGIYNSTDMATETVDVYLNKTLLMMILSSEQHHLSLIL
jgi:hypothetical protein